MRKCTININNKDYVLEINRETIRWYESMGLKFSDIEDKPISLYELIWAGTFRKNHPEVNPNLALKLFDTYQEESGDVNEVIEFAMEEYSSLISALTDTKSKKKKAKIVGE